MALWDHPDTQVQISQLISIWPEIGQKLVSKYINMVVTFCASKKTEATKPA
jgi:hypothetical protein